jgi:hypothetical protein
LQAHALPGQVNHAHIETANAFHAYHISFFEKIGGGIAVKIFPATIIKTYFNNPAATFGVAERQVRQPVMHIQTVTATCATTTIAFTSRGFAIGSRSTIATSHILQKLTMNNK